MTGGSKPTSADGSRNGQGRILAPEFIDFARNENFQQGEHEHDGSTLQDEERPESRRWTATAIRRDFILRSRVQRERVLRSSWTEPDTAQMVRTSRNAERAYSKSFLKFRRHDYVSECRRARLVGQRAAIPEAETSDDVAGENRERARTLDSETVKDLPTPESAERTSRKGRRMHRSRASRQANFGVGYLRIKPQPCTAGESPANS